MKEKCQMCNGEGHFLEPLDTCLLCHGAHNILVVLFERTFAFMPCPLCNEPPNFFRLVAEVECPDCNGTGWVDK